MIEIGKTAPLFRAASTRGDIDLAGVLAPGPVVLYFFPKANTPG
jgi:peroxiredoxin